MSLPFKLYRLQQLDNQIDQDQKKLIEIEIAINDDKSLKYAFEEKTKANQSLLTSKRNLEDAEEAVKQTRIKIETSEASLYSGKIRNPKELQDLQNEINSLTKYLAVLEERQLEAMVTFEDEEKNYRSVEEKYNSELTQFNIQKNENIKEKEKIQLNLSHLKSERDVIVNSITKVDLELYESLRKQRRGIAVARVVNQACSACGSTLNAKLLQSASLPNLITRCDTCGRILYSGY